jgi:hypothetical protein
MQLIAIFGDREHDGKGGVRLLMTGAAVRRATRALGANARLLELTGSYVVLDAETETAVITAGHRHD